MGIQNGKYDFKGYHSLQSIKPFVIGRKNFLFFNTPREADASAEIYSIIETAKANDLNPFRYIEHILETLAQLPDPTGEDYEKLLPWSRACLKHVRLVTLKKI